MLFRPLARPAVVSFIFLSLITVFFAPRATAAPLSSLPAGSVIDLGDGHPWLWVGSTAQTGTKAGYGYIMAMYNYGNAAWGSNNQTPTTAISTTSDTGSIYSSLPATIGGVAKATALASNTWQWNNCSTAGSCTNTVTSTSRLSFVSYQEWQGTTTYAYNSAGGNSEPSAGSVGNRFCQAWTGGACLGSSLYSTFGYPWARSGISNSSGYAWYLVGYSSISLDSNGVGSSYGSLPVAWLSSSLCTDTGDGTFASPYTLGECSPPPPPPASSLSPGDIISFNHARYVVLANNYTDANAVPQNTTYVMALSAVDYRPFDQGGNSNLPDITDADNLLYYLNSPDNGNFYASIDDYYQNWIVPTNYGIGDCSSADATGCNLAAQNSTVKQLYITNPSVSEWISGADLYAQGRFGETFNGTDDYLINNALLRNPLTSGQVTGLDAKGAPTSIAANAPTAIYPSLNLKSTLITCAGSGTFADPYYLGDGTCDNFIHPAEPQLGTLDSLKTGDVVETSKLVMKAGDYHEHPDNTRLFTSINDHTVDLSDPSVESVEPISDLQLINYAVDYCRLSQERSGGGCQAGELTPPPQAITLKRDVYVISGAGTRASPYQTLHADTITSDIVSDLEVRLSGYLFYASSAAAELDGLTFVRHLENNYSIYKRDLAPLPDSATDSATVPYYFLVNFFTQNPKLGEMTLVP